MFRDAAYPTPGSGMQADVQAVSAGAIDTARVASLPAEAWMVSAYTLDWKAAWDMESAVTLRDVALDAYAVGVGRSGPEVKAAVEAFLEENAGLYGKDTTMALMHLPGSQGLAVDRWTIEPRGQGGDRQDGRPGDGAQPEHDRPAPRHGELRKPAWGPPLARRRAGAG
ncbi:MAG: hypothetical protein KC501_16585 [Myxococcales bacterium]|nr:hypothetical protein [Myxococcales bacterium]